MTGQQMDDLTRLVKNAKVLGPMGRNWTDSMIQLVREGVMDELLELYEQNRRMHEQQYERSLE